MAAASSASAKKYKCVWQCNSCGTSCFPTTAESRCICGHRLRNHGSNSNHTCDEKKCECKGFYYIPSEGSWMLRCRCKRKATEHAPVKPYKSTKPPLNGVICIGFDSPWVCNCGCPWSNHNQRFEEIKLSARIISAGVPIEMMDEESVGMDVLDAGVKRGGVVEFLRGEDICKEQRSIVPNKKISADLEKSVNSDSTVADVASVQHRADATKHDTVTGFRQLTSTIDSGGNFNSTSSETKENVLKKLNRKIKMMSVE